MQDEARLDYNVKKARNNIQNLKKLIRENKSNRHASESSPLLSKNNKKSKNGQNEDLNPSSLSHYVKTQERGDRP